MIENICRECRNACVKKVFNVLFRTYSDNPGQPRRFVIATQQREQSYQTGLTYTIKNNRRSI
jgi:hypothetical protein